MVFPTSVICAVCQPPTILKVNSLGFLHNETGPAISYSGFCEGFYLNGVRMQDWHVLTDAEKLNPIDVLKENNVEVRRELIRKIGIERMLAVLPHEILEKKNNYELISINLSEEVTEAKYLKMENASLGGIFHLEGIDPSCNTVEQALNWRNNNLFENAEVLT